MYKVGLNKILISSIFFILLSMINNMAYAQYAHNNGGDDQEKEFKDQYKVVTLQKGLMIKTVLQHHISSKLNNIDDQIETMILVDMQMDGVTCLPKGTKLIGKISKIGKPEIGKNASIQIIFNTLKIPDQKNTSILAYIWTPEGYSTLGGELTSRTGYKRIVHKIQGIGGVMQLVPDGPRKMGSEIEYSPGTEFFITLEKPLILKFLKD